MDRLDTATAIYKILILAQQYLEVVFQQLPNDPGRLLAELAPTRTTAPNAGFQVAHGTRRYHTGDVNDPIPIAWYKPQNRYAQVKVGTNTLNFPNTAGTRLVDQYRNTFQLGVSAGNIVGVGRVLHNARGGLTRTRQQEFNQALAFNNFDLSSRHMDGDHVTDLGFGGQDVDDNFWPLDSTVNQRALVWRTAYRFFFKEITPNGPVLRSGTLNGLPNKYFKIVREEDANIPGDSNTDTAGSDTTWGNPQIIDVNGTRTQEA